MENRTELLTITALYRIGTQKEPKSNLFKEDWNTLMLAVHDIMTICFDEDFKYQELDLVSKFYDIRDCIPDKEQTYKACLDFSIMYINLITIKDNE